MRMGHDTPWFDRIRSGGVAFKGGNMSRCSGHDHSQSELDHHANQMNPNNDAYQDRMDNHADQLNPNHD